MRGMAHLTIVVGRETATLFRLASTLPGWAVEIKTGKCNITCGVTRRNN